MSVSRLDAAALRDWAHTAVGDLITHADEINRLNVFPVADCDTGANMLFTMRSALAEANSQTGSGDVAQVAAALSEGALRGARGNSGVILSQILRGMAEISGALAAETGELTAIDAAALGMVLRHAVGLVVSSMGGQVVAGTIVSVLEAAAGAAEASARDRAPLAAAIAASCDAAFIALEKTPDQLDVLAEAGVVDAGGRGLLVLLDALSSTIIGQAPARPSYAPATRDPGAVEGEAPPAFEVMYQLSDCDAGSVAALRDRLAQLGESVAIAAAGALGASGAASGASGPLGAREDTGHYSVHVHTDDAGGAVEAGLAFGSPGRIQISALTAGVNGLPPGSWMRERAVLAVVDGGGAAQLFAGEGASVLRLDPDAADPTAAVSAQQLLRALVDTAAAQVMVLPNGYVAAEELVAACTAAIGWGIDVVPLPTGSVVQGLAALAVHDPGRQAVDDGYAMARAAGAARHGSVRVAAEQALTWAGACEPGDGLGIAGGEVLIVADDVASAGTGLIDLMLAAGGELVTVLTGGAVHEDVGGALAEHVHRHHPGIELVTYHTGHGGDALLIGVE